jgi:uncharacterized membrane protein
MVVNKAEFLKSLEADLQKMNAAEKKKYIIYYDEMISDYVENGVAEEEAVNKIGSPAKIAEELLEDYDCVKLNLPSTGSKVLNITLTIIGFPLWGSVLLSIALFVLSIYIMIWCVPFSAAAGCVGIFTAAIVGIIGSPFVMANSVSVGIMQLGLGIASIGASVLLGIAAIYLSKKFVEVTKKFNAKLVALFQKKVVIR